MKPRAKSNFRGESECGRGLTFLARMSMIEDDGVHIS